jgi:hypothetical protein
MNADELYRQQIIQSLINKYGMDYLDHLDYNELEELMEQEERYG